MPSVLLMHKTIREMATILSEMRHLYLRARHDDVERHAITLVISAVQLLRESKNYSDDEIMGLIRSTK